MMQGIVIFVCLLAYSDTSFFILIHLPGIPFQHIYLSPSVLPAQPEFVRKILLEHGKVAYSLTYLEDRTISFSFIC